MKLPTAVAGNYVGNVLSWVQAACCVGHGMFHMPAPSSLTSNELAQPARSCRRPVGALHGAYDSMRCVDTAGRSISSLQSELLRLLATRLCWSLQHHGDTLQYTRMPRGPLGPQRVLEPAGCPVMVTRASSNRSPSAQRRRCGGCTYWMKHVYTTMTTLCFQRLGSNSLAVALAQIT